MASRYKSKEMLQFFTDQDDILGTSAVLQLPVPRYTQQEAEYLTVARKALEDRAQCETPQDSLYFCPRTDPSAATYDELLQHPVEERPRMPWRDTAPPALLQEQYDLLRGYFEAIREGSWNLVAQLLKSGLVDAQLYRRKFSASAALPSRSLSKPSIKTS